jgi:hypothetical protein
MGIPTGTSSERRQLVARVAISAVIGLVCAAISAGMIGVFPPGAPSNDLRVSVAATQVLVDTGPSSIVHRRTYPVSALVQRAEMLGRVLTSPPVLERVARRVRVPVDQIGASARSTANVPLALSEPGSEQRASDIQSARRPYNLEVQARRDTPILDIAARAPSTAEARRLADAAVAGLRGYLGDLSEREAVSETESVHLRQLGSARGGPVATHARPAIAILTFILTFSLSLAILYWSRIRRSAAARRAEPDDGDQWPHTTRVLPWMLAGFIAVLWLVPFNEIQLTAKLPIDLKFDRLVLPFVALTWVVALALSGRVAPRIRLTGIHLAVAAFVICAFLSVILNAQALSQNLELDGSVKQLPLLVAYVSLFVITASAVRRTEVRAFMTYTLGLAVICAIGVIWEYRFKQNLFRDWADQLLPGIFEVSALDTSAVDNIGRRMVRGPAALPLEAVAMLSMALPIGLVGLLQAKEWRGRILYGLGACLLLAAMFATYRKSALLAPLSVVATVAYFRRRELLKLAPLALVLVVLVHVLAPGAIGSTTNQFDPSRLGVTTVSDRAADYDAVRPDVWTDLLFGRGWGSYDHVTYRILDSELLHRTIEMGVIGLLAFIGMGIAVVVCARRTINARDPELSPPALAGAAAAVSFLVVATLFDVLAFPHATYIFLYMAGLVAVVVARPGEAEGDKPDRLHGGREHRPLKVPAVSRRPSAERPSAASFDLHR